VKVLLVPSAVPSTEPFQYATAYLVNDTLAVDAGCVGFYGSAQDQARVRHVVISHTHMDHVASLPIFVENAYEGKRDCVTVHGSDAVLDCLRTDLFNNRVWPDFLAMSPPNAPFLKLSTLEADKAVELEGLRITPIAVNHVVPTLGFLLEDADAAVLIVSDTGPTDEIWRRANQMPNLKAVFLEACFPNQMQWLADVSKHLTPRTFADEVRKLHRPVPVYAVHIKARFRPQVVEELHALGLPNVHVGEFGRAYTI
jgi:ribonuclease BN (tRNA processing enzyme)